MTSTFKAVRWQAVLMAHSHTANAIVAEMLPGLHLDSSAAIESAEEAMLSRPDAHSAAARRVLVEFAREATFTRLEKLTGKGVGK